MSQPPSESSSEPAAPSGSPPALTQPSLQDESTRDAEMTVGQTATSEDAPEQLQTTDDFSEGQVGLGDERGNDEESLPEMPRIVASDQQQEITRFAEFALPQGLLRAIDELGFTQCTPIQSQALPYSLANYDVTGQAQTGTGKTAAFLATIFTRLCEEPRKGEAKPGAPRALVLAPTRELALQIEKDARALGRYLHFGILSVVGGMNFDRQKATLEEEVIDLLVATPGRLIDFLNRNSLQLRNVDVLVIDEADRMLDMGFIPDVRRIVYRTPPKRSRQTLFFSATFNDDVLNLARQWTFDPVYVAITPSIVATDTVDQRIYLTSQRDKFRVLYHILQQEQVSRVLVFANRRDVTRDVYERLISLGVNCEMLSGDVPQRKRLRALEQFRSGEIPVLIATDVAGRGIHVDAVSHVINYNLPEDPEDYVHRIGRTGRAGASGISISLVSEEDAFELPQIEKLIGYPINCENPPAELMAPLPTKEGRRQQRSGEPRPSRRPADTTSQTGDDFFEQDRAGEEGTDVIEASSTAPRDERSSA